MSERDWTRREREALREELRGKVRGEVRFTETDRALYATDASIYQVMPLGVVVPKDREDAATAIRICLEAGAPVLPRGGGTSLAGQTVGQAVVFDFSRHLHGVLSVDPEARTCVVEPGMIQDRLNVAMAPHGLMLGPDTASGSRATLGGMLGNNSSGSHSILYGKTVDAVRSVDAVLSDGRIHTLGPVDAAALAAVEGKGPLADLKRLGAKVRNQYRDEIVARYPKVMRRVSGYNLDAFLADEVNLAHVLVGSEGSLGTALSMEVDLVPAPATKGIALLHFAKLEPAIAATVMALETGPSAVELMDDMLLTLAQANPTFAKKLWFLREDTHAVQIVEYFADNAAELEAKFAQLEDLATRIPGCLRVTRAENTLQIHDAWAIRKAGLPLLSSIPGKRKPLPFVEDTAVDPEKLPEFVRRFKEVVDAHETQAAYYAHASAGCLHIRPLLDLSDQADRGRLESISEAIFELVVEFGGSMSGEHGDGRARSHYNARMFGPEIYSLFQELKHVLDPKNLFNPGQVVDAPAMGDDLRWDFNHTPQLPSTGFGWKKEEGFRTAVSSCNGTAACRQVGDGAMCPSFKATLDEEHSTRGRANLLRNAMNGAVPESELYGPEIEQALELCLMCKACISDCPVRVDMSKIKAEWMHAQNQTLGVRPSRWLLARPRTWLEYAGWSPKFANWMSGTWIGKKFTEVFLELDPARPLPKIYEGRPPSGKLKFKQPDRAAYRGKIVLFADTFSKHFSPEPLLDAAKVLDLTGHDVEIPSLGCCGRPAVGQGHLEHARALAEANVEALGRYMDEGIPVVGLEPGCLSMIWDEYPDLVRDRARAEAVGKHVKLFEEYFLELPEDSYTPKLAPVGEVVGFHPHCHQDALGRSEATLQALQKIPGLEVRKLGGGCCGMAGDFGHRHVDLSEKVWSQTEASEFEGPVCVPGWSCRSQFGHQGKSGFSAATLIRKALDGEKVAPGGEPLSV